MVEAVKSNISISFGEVSVLAYHPKNEITGVAVCIHGMGVQTFEEWFATAELLASLGWSCFVPLFHSNEMTKPGTLSMENATMLISAVLQQLAKDQKGPFVVLGKSWGGLVAATFCSSCQGQDVSKLVVVCPAVQDVALLEKIKCPVLLQWCRDDNIIPFDLHALWDKVQGEIKKVFYDSGGHRVHADFAEEVRKFVVDAG
eukprot:gnl/MRDRNA2_/MRDRNA2_194431_c0_seq1.p1 gnl/MRDRNA2_/MRDRNA2_194431_c0~~gnl/MRDRNA2_/MRDRNA2_194431_c0_seq1.p1  ORF type:complete len:201 (-),score=34.00 gnl/MRDRNA2_/MRDRNA2_194431_c0_seq1:35-637(-)